MKICCFVLVNNLIKLLHTKQVVPYLFQCLCLEYLVVYIWEQRAPRIDMVCFLPVPTDEAIRSRIVYHPA